MKKNIMAILIIGVFSLLAVAGQAQGSRDDHGNRGRHHGNEISPVEMLKGKVLDLNHDQVWDFVTFGLESEGTYEVSSVELIGEDGLSLGSLDFQLWYSREDVSWFAIDLKGIQVPNNFYLQVIVTRHSGSNAAGTGVTMNASRSTGGIPNDPEETVLIVKYP